MSMAISPPACPSLSYKARLGAGEMAQWLKAIAGLAQETGFVPSTYKTAHNHL